MKAEGKSQQEPYKIQTGQMKGSNPEKKELLATTESVTDRLGNSSVEKALKDTEMFMNPVCILSAMTVNGILD